MEGGGRLFGVTGFVLFIIFTRYKIDSPSPQKEKEI